MRFSIAQAVHESEGANTVHHSKKELRRQAPQIELLLQDVGKTKFRSLHSDQGSSDASWPGRFLAAVDRNSEFSV